MEALLSGTPARHRTCPAASADAIRVGIVDDHAITRLSLTQFLGEQDGITVVGQACNGREAIDLSRKVPMDVMLLDLEMPVQSGLDSLAHIRGHSSSLAVIALSGYPPSSFGITMMKNGASGFLSKQCEPAEIVKAIRAVAQGHFYLTEDLRALLLDATTTRAAIPHSRLTPRELQVALRMARGQDCHAIALDLSMSPKTVNSHRTRIMSKLDMRTSSDLTYYALKQGLLD